MADNSKLTITLYDRRPVRIIKDDWPIIAQNDDHDGKVECQANEKWWLKARQHKDGRCIVYGALDSCFPSKSRRGGMICTNYSLPETIKLVGERLGLDEHFIDRCIADLPADEI